MKKLAIVFAFFAFSGCGSQSDRPVVGSEPAEHRQLVGGLVENIRKLQAATQGLSGCDLAAARAQLEIAQALDDQADELARIAASNPVSDTYDHVPLGSILVRERKKPYEPRPDWIEDKLDTWQALREWLGQIQGQPIGRGWLSLNRAVRARLVYDQDRVIYGYGYYLEKDMGPAIASLRSQVSACLNDPRCERPAISEEAFALIARIPRYGASHKAIESASAAERREMMKIFSAVLTQDAERYEFVPYAGARFAAPDVLELKIDSGGFSGVQAKLADYIERVWRKPGLRLQVKWVEPNAFPDLFRVIAEPAIGELSYVSRESRKVHLFSEVRANSIAHEFGHVLGFKDRYFRQWKEGLCTYLEQYSEADLMSDPEGGSVTDDEWSKLREVYASAGTH